MLFVSRTIDTASLEFGAAPEAVSQVQPALRLKVANIISTPSDGKPAPGERLLVLWLVIIIGTYLVVLSVSIVRVHV